MSERSKINAVGMNLQHGIILLKNSEAENSPQYFRMLFLRAL